MIVIAFGLVITAVLYALGSRRAGQSRNVQLAFWSGLASLAIALLPPLHELSESFFSAHMVQHTILMTVSAPLIVLGRPVLVSLWALPLRFRRRLVESNVSSAARTLTQTPITVAFIIHSLAIWIWHLPRLYDAALQSEPIHAAQHLSFLLTAMLFWNCVLAPRTRATSLGKGVFFVFATAAHTAVLGAMIALAHSPLYAFYQTATPRHGVSVLEDQQLAGLIMWVPAGLLYTLAGVALLIAWLKQMESRNALRSFASTAAMLVVAMIGLSGCHGYAREQALGEQSAALMTGGDPRVGKDAIEAVGCGGCHTIDGVRDANGEVGPPLNGIVRRTYIAGVLTNTPEHLARWIVDPKSVDSLTAMPALGLTPQDARNIAAYLYTLK